MSRDCGILSKDLTSMIIMKNSSTLAAGTWMMQPSYPFNRQRKARWCVGDAVKERHLGRSITVAARVLITRPAA